MGAKSQVTAINRDGLPMPCPECRMRGAQGAARIGTKVNECRTCRWFANHARRRAERKLILQHPDHYRQFQIEAEIALYPQAIEDFNDERKPEMLANLEREGLTTRTPIDGFGEPLGIELDPISSWEDLLDYPDQRPTPSEETVVEIVEQDEDETGEVSWDPTPHQGMRGQAGLR